MTGSEVISVGKQRSRREINRLVVEFESSGLRQREFYHKHGLASAEHLAVGSKGVGGNWVDEAKATHG
jgi:hypothetical protein